MAVDLKALNSRVSELTEQAKARGFNSVERELDRLPDDDVAARLGYLASLLDVDLGVAFDREANIEQVKGD